MMMNQKQATPAAYAAKKRFTDKLLAKILDFSDILTKR